MLILFIFFLFAYLGHNPATALHGRRGKRSKCRHKLSLALLAEPGSQVSMHTHFQTNVNRTITLTFIISLLLRVGVCVLQWLCCGKHSVSDIHLFFSVRLYPVEEAACKNMGR